MHDSPEKGGVALRVLSLSIVGIALLASGCASWCKVTSDPPGATVTINGRYYGETPREFAIRSSTFGQYHIRLEKEGYEPLEDVMPKQLFVGRLVVDILLFWPAALFNAMGPMVYPPYEHHYTLTPLGEG